jgi:Coenzyme PQQ synthesis protein D (PqqD)
MIELHPELAFEYLDDGGVLICQLERGDYWQLSAPSGQIWQWVWESRDFRTAATSMARGLSVDEAEAAESLAALCDQLRDLGIVVDYRRAS